jgi:hypothetical protein
VDGRGVSQGGGGGWPQGDADRRGMKGQHFCSALI